jgi:hypothetical protein
MIAGAVRGCQTLLQATITTAFAYGARAALVESAPVEWFALWMTLLHICPGPSTF